MKKNCWEIKTCGREPGGNKVAELGICPVCTALQANGANDGLNAGRICWAVAGTFCGGTIQGSFVEKQVTCMNCNFFQQVKQEEGDDFKLLLPNQKYKAKQI